VAQVLREVDRDLAKGLTIADVCRKIGVAQTTYYRWRQRHDPVQVDSDRRCRELETEVDRLKRLVAELKLDKQMLQDVAKKEVVSPVQQRAAADYLSQEYGVSQRRIGRVLGRSRSNLRYRGRTQRDAGPLSREIKRLARRHPRFGLPADPRHVDPPGMVARPEAGATALERDGVVAAVEAAKAPEIRPQARGQRQQLHESACSI
jgi:transposase-like protein